MLLRYFGERGAAPCGKCDNCRKHRSAEHSALYYEAYREMLAELLADGQPHTMDEVRALHIEPEVLPRLLQHLVEQEEATLQDGLIIGR